MSLTFDVVTGGEAARFLAAPIEDLLWRAAPSGRYAFVALSAERLAEWMASDLSKLDLLIVQIDGLHLGNDLVLVAALGDLRRGTTPKGSSDLQRVAAGGGRGPPNGT